MSNRVSKTDITDVDIIDAYELISDGYGLNSIYLNSILVSTTSGTKTVVINLPADGEGIFYGVDHPAEANDIVWLSGTSGGLADGYFTIATVIDDVTFTINETFGTSTGGNIQFRYPAGALKVGFDPRNTTHVTHNDVQHAIEDLDAAISGGGGGITPTDHEKLRQLIHLADGIGGPFEGFPSGAYRESLPVGAILPTTVTWYSDFTKTQIIVKKTISYLPNKLPFTFQWDVYRLDGVTLLATVNDTLTYVGGFESYRIRAIIDFGPPSGSGLDTNTHKIVRQLIHLADGVGGPFEGFTSGAYREITPTSNPFPTSIIWYDDITKVKKIVEKTVAYNTNKSVSSVTWKVYDTDGSTVLATVSDSINYSGIFEINRIRSVS